MNQDNNKYPDDLDEFTLELMIGIVGEKNMFLDNEIQERNNTKQNTKAPTLSMKDRFESAKLESERKLRCNAKENTYYEER